MSETIEGALVRSEATAIRVAPAMEWSREQVDLIKRTVCPNDATDDELKLFLHVAKKAGLDPLQKQIHCTKRQGRLTIIAGIDGLQARANREPDYLGTLHGVVCAKDDFLFDAASGKVIKHTYNAFGDRGPVVGAWASVERKGMLPFNALVRFSEFNQSSSPTWRQMPTVMIAKVARSTALRMAFPEQFSSIYEEAEMDQADNSDRQPEGRRVTLPETTTVKMDAPTPPRKTPEQLALEAKEQARRARAKRVWNAVRDMNNGTEIPEAIDWCADVLCGKKSSADWTDEDLDQLERALLATEPPEEVVT